MASAKLIFAPAGSQVRGQAAQFRRGTLVRSELNPIDAAAQFAAWFGEAQAAAASSPTAETPETCTLSTAHLPSGRVSSRIVYLKELNADGRFVVYSNWATSRKAADLASNPHVALAFYWAGLQRQVRVEGVAGRIPAAESQLYFDTRARGSRIGAWASRQSQVLEPAGDGDDGRAQLEGWVAEAEERFRHQDHIPVPDFWGGLSIRPTRIEFWQGRDSRLHDRFVYEWEDQEDDAGTGGRHQEVEAGIPEYGKIEALDKPRRGQWKLERLSP